ncbi:hypothetical protein T484DRAFT_1769165 [Baffinella frigidus]|nr:hypothetical protein T484DRAFT_1769165 [Cryptophyta sp. CCMP2293]
MFHAVTPPAVVGSHREYYNKYADMMTDVNRFRNAKSTKQLLADSAYYGGNRNDSTFDKAGIV